MGSRSSSFCCQSVTNAIVFMLFKIGILVLNYLNDLAFAEKPELADFSFLTLRTMLQKCGIEESVKKACAPSTIMPFLGILFNTELMTFEIIPERLREIKSLLIFWLDKDSASLKGIQSLIGKLNFIAACVRPGRVFISRLGYKLMCDCCLICKSETQNYVKRVSVKYIALIDEHAFPPTGFAVGWFSFTYFAFVICKEFVAVVFFLPSLFLSFAKLYGIMHNVSEREYWVGMMGLLTKT